MGTATSTVPVVVANSRYNLSGLTFAKGSYYTVPANTTLDIGAGEPLAALLNCTG